ncbi:hypothetical protein C8J57DRAFT_1731107 [Mycena rebaudengoi]|nr:hypothetical protein C8J57DRAFT_1731107 [Mycena rebaudengoi]
MTIPPVVGRHLLLAPSLGLKHTLFDPLTWHSSNVAVCLSMSQALQVSRPYPLLKLLLDPHTLVKVKPAINSQVQVIVKVLLALRTHPSGIRLPFTAQGPHALSAAVSAIGRTPTLSRLPSRPPPTRRMPPVPNRRRFAPLPHGKGRKERKNKTKKAAAVPVLSVHYPFPVSVEDGATGGGQQLQRADERERERQWNVTRPPAQGRSEGQRMHTARATGGARRAAACAGCSPPTTDTSFFFLPFFLSTRFGSVSFIRLLYFT